MKEGDLIPDITLRSVSADGTKNFGLHDNFKFKRAMIICVPGAFTSTCHIQHLPPFIKGAKKFSRTDIKPININPNKPSSSNLNWWFEFIIIFS